MVGLINTSLYEEECISFSHFCLFDEKCVDWKKSIMKIFCQLSVDSYSHSGR